MVFSLIHSLNHVTSVYSIEAFGLFEKNSLMVRGISTRKLKVCHVTGDLRYWVLGVVMKVVE